MWGVVGGVFGLITILVLVFYLLVDWHPMLERVDGTLPRDHAPTVRRLAGEINDAVAAFIDDLNRGDAERGRAPRLSSPHDAYAITGAVVELASRQIRVGVPGDIRELEPVVERLILGLLAAGDGR